MTPNPEHLYGPPGAEYLHIDPEDVWVCDLDGRDDDNGPWVVDEWAVHPPRYHLDLAVDADTVLYNILESVHSDGELSPMEDDWFNTKDPAIQAAVENLFDVICSTVKWRQAHYIVAEHEMSFVDGEPLFDGEPL